MISISNSEMAAWTRCPRSWMTHYYLGFVPAGDAPTGTRQLGTRVHTAMEALYGYDIDPLLVLKAIYAGEIEAHPEFEHELRSEWDMANAMIQGYQEWAVSEGKESDYRVMAIEQDVRVPLPGMPGVELRARLDQAVQEISTGAYLFRDWKTSDSFEAHEMLELQPQFKLYSVISHLQHGVPFHGPVPDGAIVPAGGIITTLRRCKRTAKSNPPYYRQDPFSYNPEQLHSALIRVQQICGEIMTARAKLDWCYTEDGGRGALAIVNAVQRTVCRPVPIARDCSWRCDLSKGLCVSMDDGADWAGMLTSSGRWKRENPYEYYERDGLAAIRSQLASL